MRPARSTTAIEAMAPHSADAVVAMVRAIASDTSRCIRTCASELLENVHAATSTAQKPGRIHMISPPQDCDTCRSHGVSR